MKILFILLAFTSCSFLPSRAPDPSPHLITGGSDIAGLSSTDMKQLLQKSVTMAGGIFLIDALPLSKPYLDKKWKEQAEARSLNSKNYRSGVLKNVDRFISRKSCVQFDYSVTKFEKTKELSNWKIAIEINDESFPLEWINPSSTSNTFVSEQPTATHKDKRWHNSAIACTPVSLDLWRGFTLKIHSAFIPWPFSENTSIDWIFKALTRDDEAAVEELRKKNYQKYRGW